MLSGGSQQEAQPPKGCRPKRRIGNLARVRVSLFQRSTCKCWLITLGPPPFAGSARPSTGPSRSFSARLLSTGLSLFFPAGIPPANPASAGSGPANPSLANPFLANPASANPTSAGPAPASPGTITVFYSGKFESGGKTNINSPIQVSKTVLQGEIVMEQRAKVCMTDK